MKPNTYWASLMAIFDTGEGSCTLLMKNHGPIKGYSRNETYGDRLPKGAAWFGLEGPNQDIVIDIASVVAIIPYTAGG